MNTIETNRLPVSRWPQSPKKTSQVFTTEAASVNVILKEAALIDLLNILHPSLPFIGVTLQTRYKLIPKFLHFFLLRGIEDD